MTSLLELRDAARKIGREVSDEVGPRVAYVLILVGLSEDGRVLSSATTDAPNHVALDLARRLVASLEGKQS